MRFDFDEVFGDDYLSFSEARLSDEQSERDTDFVRMPSITELRAWLAGFIGAEFLARDGEAPSIHRPRLIVVATA